MKARKKGLFILLTFGLIAGLGFMYFFDKSADRLPNSAFYKNVAAFKQSGVPPFTLLLMGPRLDSGSPFEFKRPQSPLTVINFWATWCGPCVLEMPSLLEFARRYEGKIEILAISEDESLDVIKQFLKSHKWEALPSNFKVLLDKDLATANLYGTHEFPETYIVTRELKLVEKIVGPEDWSNPFIIRWFNLRLKEASPHGA